MPHAAQRSAAVNPAATDVVYELRLSDPQYVMEEAGEYFSRRGAVWEAMKNLNQRMESEGIDFVLIGALALALHGYSRMTVDIDVLIAREGLEKFHDLLIGRGYIPAFPGARRSIRETENRVRIDMVLAGEYPGDGKPKEIAFPSPEQAKTLVSGMPVVPLETLIELKLASGISAPHRALDLADVIALIRARSLDAELAEHLHPVVREKYRELWVAAQTPEVVEEQEQPPQR